MPVAAALLAGIGAGCLIGGLGCGRRSIRLRREALASGVRGPRSTGTSDGPLGRIGRGVLGRRLAARDLPVLAAAGWMTSPDAFAGLRVLGGSCGLIAGLVLPWPGPILAPMLAAVGLRAPLVVLRRSAERRRGAIDAEVPQLLDLLAAASSAGLSGQLALRRAVDAVEGPLASELDRTLSRVDLGARWRDELVDLAARTGVPDLRRVVGALTRTETLGASLETSTTELAANVRAARRAAITERARTAPVKMLFPLVFLILPAFLLLTVVPVLLTTLQSIR